jgi:hypothetical protein
VSTLAFDTETHLIERFKPLPRLVCATFAAGASPDDVLLLTRGEQLRAFMSSALGDPAVKFVGHNVAYDFGVLGNAYPELLPAIFEAYQNNRITDTGIRQQLFDIAFGRVFAGDKLKSYSLAVLSELILDEVMAGKKGMVDEGDPWRLRYSELDGVPLEDWPEAAVSYAKQDALTTWRIWHEQEEGARDYLRDDSFQTYAAFVLTLTASQGMRTDEEAVIKCAEHWENKKAELLPDLEAAGLIVKGVKKVAPAQEQIRTACEARGVEPPLTAKGKVSTDKVACLIAGDELMLKRAEYVTAEKMLSTYIPTLIEGVRGPIATRFQMAATGRTTSSAPGAPLVGTNLQNAPRKGGIRETFKPRDGKVYLSADFSGAELHTLAQACKLKLGYSTLGEALNRGDDVHLKVGAELLGISYEEAKTRKKDKEVKESRQNAKAANFGFPGGMGNYTFRMTQLKQSEKFWTEEEARDLKAAWLQAFPEMVEYFEYNQQILGIEEECVIEIPYSRRLRKVSTFPSACNTWFQALAADGAKAALAEVTRLCYTVPSSALYDARPVNFVHDEVILEIADRAEVYQPAAVEFEKVMSDAFNRFTPDYPTSTEAVLMRVWSKNAEQAFDERGGLIPWEPSE